MTRPPLYKKDEVELDSYQKRPSTAISTVPIYRLKAITKISRNTLTKYKHLQSSPDMRKLCLIAEATDTSVKWILFGHTANLCIEQNNCNNARS